MPLEIYAVKITERTGHQKDNDHWSIGAFLKYRPEITEDCHGPGGGATYIPVKPENATFGDRNGANAIIRFMARRYPDVKVTRVRFVEAP